MCEIKLCRWKLQQPSAFVASRRSVRITATCVSLLLGVTNELGACRCQQPKQEHGNEY